MKADKAKVDKSVKEAVEIVDRAISLYPEIEDVLKEAKCCAVRRARSFTKKVPFFRSNKELHETVVSRVLGYLESEIENKHSRDYRLGTDDKSPNLKKYYILRGFLDELRGYMSRTNSRPKRTPEERLQRDVQVFMIGQGLGRVGY